jgi:hypothetical protein
MGASGPSLCAVQRAECQACNAIAGMDGLDLDCDLFDDDLANESCYVCRDAVVEPGEECDGGGRGGPLCSSTCAIEATNALIFSNPCNGGSTLADDALGALGIQANVILDDFDAFNAAFDLGGFDLVVYDGFCSTLNAGTRTRLESWVGAGGRALVAFWQLGAPVNASLQAALGVTAVLYGGDGVFRPVHADPVGPFDAFDLRRSLPSPLNGTSAGTFYMGNELAVTGDGFLLAAQLGRQSAPSP